jgi:amidohydrolase
MNRSVDIARLVTLRHDLHAHAELGGREIETSRIIREFLEECEPDRLVTGLGGCGLAAVFEGRGEGPTLMVRAEIDAVSVQEANAFDHRSLNDGVAHKCGHDGHAATLAGLAAGLAVRPSERGRVILLFQPAEETGAGARGVLEDEQFGPLEPDWIFALHNLPGDPLGVIQIKSGPFAAGSVGVIMKLEGRTSHAARPEQGRSPADAIARLVQELSSIPASLGGEGDVALVTVVHARIGEATFGITPGDGEVMATLRSDREETLDRLRGAVIDRLERLASADRLEPTYSWAEYFPLTTNHPEAVDIVETVASARGIEAVRGDEPYPWSEDFGWFTRRFKGAIFGLGSGTEHTALHSPDYDFPDALIPIGLEIFEGIMERLLG